ncbi:hypothetical protein HPG69_017664 [Diceros bicornis minor]|uniref:Uncharacterized protein n=1 Tax=Diceros bicornis minor TaxID=77932 RepID=A0A7J7FKF6_DICBM|nr:hypothetical protein HPG69_017664 [Diceros bicornis minor]
MGLSPTSLLLCHLPGHKATGTPYVDVGATGAGCPIQNFAGSPEGPVAEPTPTSSDSADVFRKMDIINVTALPLVPVDEHLAVSVVARNAMKNAMRKNMEDNPPSFNYPFCSLSVNIFPILPGLDPIGYNGILAIERFELEKKVLREKSRSGPGDRGKNPFS